MGRGGMTDARSSSSSASLLVELALGLRRRFFFAAAAAGPGAGQAESVRLPLVCHPIHVREQSSLVADMPDRKTYLIVALILLLLVLGLSLSLDLAAGPRLKNRSLRLGPVRLRGAERPVHLLGELFVVDLSITYS